jgi:hypothetical protein
VPPPEPPAREAKLAEVRPCVARSDPISVGSASRSKEPADDFLPSSFVFRYIDLGVGATSGPNTMAISGSHGSGPRPFHTASRNLLDNGIGIVPSEIHEFPQ